MKQQTINSSISGDSVVEQNIDFVVTISRSLGLRV